MGAWRIAVLVWLGSVCSSATPAQQFSRRYDVLGQHEWQVAWAVEKMTNGNFLCIGNAPWTDSLYYGSSVITIEVDEQGFPIAEHRLGYPWTVVYPGWANTADRTEAGGYVLGGSTTDTTGTIRAVLIVVDDGGNVAVLSEFDEAAGTCIGYQAKQSSNNGFVVAAEIANPVYSDALLWKVDSAGETEWSETYGQLETIESIVSVSSAPNGGYYLGGQKTYHVGLSDQWVFCVDSQGELLWERTYGDSIGDSPNAHIETLADSSCVFASAFPQQAGLGGILCMVKVGAAGNTVWSHMYGAEAVNTTFFAVKEVEPFGDLITCGQSYQENGDRKGVLLRANSDGDSLWMRHYFYADSLLDDGEGSFRDVLPTDDGGFIAVGWVNYSASGNNPPQYDHDLWVVKVDSMGCLVPGCDDFSTAITSQVTNLKDALSVAPNPTRGSAVVTVSLPSSMSSSGDLRIRVVNATGQEVLVQKAVVGQNELDVHSLGAGAYYVHLTHGSTWLSGAKLIIE